MFLAFLARARSEEILGTYDLAQQFLPGVPKDLIDARGMFIDYKNNRIPLKPLVRFVDTFKTTSEEIYAVQEVFGHITSENDATDFVYNFSGRGLGGRLSNEESISLTHYLFFDSVDPGKYGFDVFAKLADPSGKNVSVLLYNQTVELYEVTDLKESFGTAFLYLFFVGVMGGILYLIFSKDKRTALAETQDKKKKKVAKEYADIHKVDRSSSPGSGKKRTQSPK